MSQSGAGVHGGSYGRSYGAQFTKPHELLQDCSGELTTASRRHESEKGFISRYPTCRERPQID